MAKEKISISLDKDLVSSLNTLGKLGWSRSSFLNFWLRNYLNDVVTHMSSSAEEVIYRRGQHNETSI